MRADDVMALIRAHAKADRKQFAIVAKQIAANDSKLWGGRFSRNILELVNGASAEGLTALPRGADGNDSVGVGLPRHRLDDLILEAPVRESIGQLLREYQHADALLGHGCDPMTKVLFDGPPGTGKTSAAGAIAAELGIPLVVTRQHELIDSHMGASDKAIAKVFDFASANRAVVFFDELDAIGSARSGAGSGAEKAYNAIVTTLLASLDRHIGPAIVVAATNRLDVLDPAICRRFDLAVHFGGPTEEVRRELIRRTLGDDDGPFAGSHAEIVRDCLREKKRRILERIIAAAEVA